MSKKLIVANWKMNPGSAAEAKKIFRMIAGKAPEYKKKVSTIICPPALYIDSFSKPSASLRSGTSGIMIGAQDAFWEESGAFTGEISAAMLAKSGVSHVITGHSERRAMGETSEMVNKKIKAALKAGLSPILCVGESDRDPKGEYHTFVKQQIMQSLAGIKKADLKRLIVAYEPVWAIGKHAAREATPAESLEMNLFIRKTLSDMFGAPLAKSVPLLYGGSVATKNAEAFLADGGVDGLLVGRESLNPEKFLIIIKIANNLSK